MLKRRAKKDAPSRELRTQLAHEAGVAFKNGIPSEPVSIPRGPATDLIMRHGNVVELESWEIPFVFAGGKDALESGKPMPVRSLEDNGDTLRFFGIDWPVLSRGGSQGQDGTPAFGSIMLRYPGTDMLFALVTGNMGQTLIRSKVDGKWVSADAFQEMIEEIRRHPETYKAEGAKPMWM